jgi:hypothetical protein
VPETTFVIHTFYLPTDDLGDLKTHDTHTHTHTHTHTRKENALYIYIYIYKEKAFYLPTDDLGDIETHEFVSRGVRLEKI